MCLFEIMVCVPNPLVKIVFSFNDIQESLCTIFLRDIIYTYQYQKNPLIYFLNMKKNKFTTNGHSSRHSPAQNIKITVQ